MTLRTISPITESAGSHTATARADIVTRLRDPSISPGPFNFAMRDEAADTIEALRKLVAAMQPLALATDSGQQVAQIDPS